MLGRESNYSRPGTSRTARGPTYTSGVRIARWEKYPVPVRVTVWGVKDAFGYLALLGFAIAYLVMGNTAGRAIGAGLAVAWVAISVRLARRFAKRFAKPS
jgi:hypothetical protein